MKTKLRIVLHKINYGIILASLYLLLNSCVNEPDFNKIPFISFNSISQKFLPNESADSIRVVLNFTDGNGDLGLNVTENDPPYNEINPDGQFNKYFNNYFIEVKKKVNGKFEKVVFPENANFNGRYPRLNTSDVERSLEGELAYTFRMYLNVGGAPISTNDTLIFEIQIADRSLNLSNTISTTEIIAGSVK
ncbi:MAG: hypothetical protein OHK0038_18800 [Flammeovirgaceae bacterium]